MLSEITLSRQSENILGTVVGVEADTTYGESGDVELLTLGSSFRGVKRNAAAIASELSD